MIDEKQAKQKKIEELGASLGRIREVVREWEEEIVSKGLLSLSEYMNKYYTAIVNHPVFRKIKLEIEKTKPLTYSFKAVGTVGETRLSTGLSNAQMNAAAIALLLAYNEKLGASLPLIVMDDPTQSFDIDYKLRLADKIAELSEQRQFIIATQDKEFLEALEKRCKKIRVYEFLEYKDKGPIVKPIK